MPTSFIDEVPTFEIKDGVVTYILPSGERRCTPLRLFRMVHARASKALGEYDSQQAEIVPFRKR